MTGWLRDLTLGARLSFAGGREGWTRVLMTAVGVGLGVAMLLVAASIPAMLDARQARGDARADMSTGSGIAGANSVLVGRADTVFQGDPIRGRVLDPEGPAAPVPPGLTALPRPGEMIVSPALADLLATERGALLRPRLPYPVAGVIGDQGLAGPRELAFYLGSDSLVNGLGTVGRLESFGTDSDPDGLGPILTMLVLVIFVVLLLPVAVFIGAAARFGGEQRDRRLAALRLIGTNAAMTRRIAAGEVLVAAVLGVAAGLVAFYACRGLVERMKLVNISVFGEDLRPSPLLIALIVTLVPAAAVGVTTLALRATIIEPLGVVRRSGQLRRRLWWRLVVPLIGLALLAPGMVGGLDGPGDTFNEYQVTIGVLLLLVGVTALLPWLIDVVVNRLRGGSVSILLAVRRLQLHSATSARVVNGIAVAAAGAIALQMLFTGVQSQFTRPTGQDPSRAQAVVTMYAAVNAGQVERIADGFNAAAGVQVLGGYAGFPIAVGDSRDTAHLVVAPCTVLRERALLPSCTDGDAFIVSSESGVTSPGMPEAGQRVKIGDQDQATRPEWTVPATARSVPARVGPEGGLLDAVFATPGALAAAGVDPRQLRDPYIITYLAVDLAVTDVYEQLRNAAFGLDPLADVTVLQAQAETNRFANIRRGLYIGVVATLLLIGASMLVTMLEQLRERRRLLAALVAFGTRRTTLSASVLWQTAIPVALGIALASVIGTGLGAALQLMTRVPVRLDGWSILTISGAAAGVVFLVTALSMPALWRLMRPEGLRSE